MSGERRLSREENRRLSVRVSELNFGLITMVLLTVVAIIVTLKFPEIQLQDLAGPQWLPDGRAWRAQMRDDTSDLNPGVHNITKCGMVGPDVRPRKSLTGVQWRI
jgi:hypothetical protein